MLTNYFIGMVMNTKITRWFVLLGVTATIIITAATITVYLPMQQDIQPPQEIPSDPEVPIPTNVIELQPEPEDSSDITENVDSYYHLGRLGSMVALFDEEGAVVEVYEIYLHLLPPDDAMALTEGIRIDSEDQLRKLLEDFGG